MDYANGMQIRLAGCRQMLSLEVQVDLTSSVKCNMQGPSQAPQSAWPARWSSSLL